MPHEPSTPPRSVQITDPAVLIRISQVYRPTLSAEELYELTRSAWRVGPRREGAKYALAVYEGIVKEVYEINAWHRAGSTEFRHRPRADVEVPGRWEFTGRVAPAEVRDRYVGGSVASTWKWGDANPVTYVNC